MVTVPVLVFDPAAIVSFLFVLKLKSEAVAGDTADAETVTVTSWLDSPLRVAVTVVEPPSSSMEDEPRTRETVGVVSSSVIVSVWSAGAATPLPPDAVAETVTCLSGASTSLSAAVMVTVLVLVMEPAAMVRVLSVLSAKSPDTAGDTAATDTVSVMSWLDTALSVAVTVVEPPSSLTDDGVSTSATEGAPSSSVIVSVWSAGAATPLPPDAVAETVTCLSGASTSLSDAVMVTVPVLVFEPAAMVRVLFALRLKSPDTAGETAAAATVTVTSSLDAALSVAVTAVEPPFSAIGDEASASVNVGVSSSSVIVTVAASGAEAEVVTAVRANSNVSSTSSISSSSTVRATSAVVSPAWTETGALAAL